MPPSSLLMYAIEALNPAVPSGKLPFGSPWGLMKPTVMGVPVALMGCCAVQVSTACIHPAY